MSSNPYSDNDQPNPYASQTQLPSGRDDSYIKQIPVVGILQIVQAALELMMGVLLIGAGIMILRKRGRMFSIVTSVLGLASVFTCYCSPTSIGLCVYTLIVLVRPSVIEEFDKALAVSDLDSVAGLE